MKRDKWLQKNGAAIEQRLAWLHTHPEGILYQKTTSLQRVQVDKRRTEIHLEFFHPISGMTQSVIDLNRPLHLLAPYNQTFMLGLAWHPNPKRVYIAGLGGGSFPLVLHHYLPQTHIECAEIDPVVLDVAQKYFGLRQDARLIVILQDAREYLAQQLTSEAVELQSYELVFVDAFMYNGQRPYHLVTQEFYQLCQSCLTPDGTIFVNMSDSDPSYSAQVRTLQTVFAHVYVGKVQVRNSVVIGTNSKAFTKKELIRQTTSLQKYHKFTFSLARRVKSLELFSRSDEIIPSKAPSITLMDSTPLINIRNKRC